MCRLLLGEVAYHVTWIIGMSQVKKSLCVGLGSANRRETHPKTRLRDWLVLRRCFGSISCEFVCDHVLLVD